MSFNNWNEECYEDNSELYGDVYEVEPNRPETDPPEDLIPQVEYGEFSGQTLIFLQIREYPSFTSSGPKKTVLPPGMQVQGDAIMLAEGYRWLRLVMPEHYAGYFTLNEAWDKSKVYLRIDHQLAVPQTLYRIKKDDPPRILDPDWPFEKMTWAAPAVHPMYINKNPAHSTKRTRLSSWETYMRSLNDTQNKWNFYTNDHSGLFNRTGWDKQETLVMGNNLVMVDRIEGFRKGQMMAKLRTLFIENPQPDPALFNYRTCPWLIHKFTVITRNGNVIDPNPGPIYYPVIVNRGGEGWIELDKLEKFPSLPMQIMVEEPAGLNVRERPDEKSDKVTALEKGAILEITEYCPVGSEIWARGELGWVALYHPDTVSKYLTSWKMETEPPPP